MLLRLAHGLLFAFATYKWGNWRNWERYYPTILFFWFGDILYYGWFYQHSLWMLYSPGVPNLFIVLYYKFVISSSAIILFLSNYPKPLWKQVLRIFLWIGIYSVDEWGLHELGYFPYFHGWSLGWSILVNFIMFPTFRLHHKRPIPALVLLMGFMGLLMYIFDISLSEVR
jgi:hypothetical protein